MREKRMSDHNKIYLGHWVTLIVTLFSSFLVSAQSNCPTNNDRHFALHFTGRGVESMLETLKNYARSYKELAGNDLKRPLKLDIKNGSHINVPVNITSDPETAEILKDLYQIGFFENLDLSRPLTFYLGLPKTILSFDIDEKKSKIEFSKHDSQVIQVNLSIAIKNFEVKIPYLELCRKLSSAGTEDRRCVGDTFVKANDLGLRVRGDKILFLNLVGEINLANSDGTSFRVLSTHLVAPRGQAWVSRNRGDWDLTENYPSNQTDYNVFVPARINSPNTLILTGATVGQVNYDFDAEGASLLVAKFLAQNFQKIISSSTGPIEKLVTGYLDDFFVKNQSQAKFKINVDQGRIEEAYEALTSERFNLQQNECLAEPPPSDELGEKIIDFLASMVTGVSLKSRLGRIEMGDMGVGQSLFFDNEYLIVSSRYKDQSLTQDHFIPEYAPTSLEKCVADPQILTSNVQRFSELPKSDSYDFAVSVSQKTFNSLFYNTIDAGILEGIIKELVNDPTISLVAPKVQFVKKENLNYKGFNYTGTVYLQTGIYIDFKKLQMNAADEIGSNFFSAKTLSNYLTFYGLAPERLFGSGDVGLVPIEIRLDILNRNSDGKNYIFGHSLFTSNGYFRNELGQATSQERMFSTTLNSVKRPFLDFDRKNLNKYYELKTDFIEQWLLGSFGAQVGLQSLHATNGGQLIAFFNFYAFDRDRFLTCRPQKDEI